MLSLPTVPTVPAGPTNVTFAQLRQLSSAVASATTWNEAIEAIEAVVEHFPVKDDRGTWRYYAVRLLDHLKKGKPFFRLFQKGNGKLPFACWSVLPFVTCPGMGECGSWCYSVRAWRTPGGFFRQLQNTMFLRFRPEDVRNAFLKLKQGIKIRLYVDGDFSSIEDVRFWFSLLKQRPDLKVYGYSKSWDELWQYSQEDTLPGNYRLNLSSGGKIREVTLEQISTLAIVRGRFLAVKVHGDFPRGTARYDSREYYRAVVRAAREEGIEKPFSCPGKCGTCVRGEHACGNDRFHGVNIVIGVH